MKVGNRKIRWERVLAIGTCFALLGRKTEGFSPLKQLVSRPPSFPHENESGSTQYLREKKEEGLSSRHKESIRLASYDKASGSDDDTEQPPDSEATDWRRFVLFASTGFLYWYLMVFGAAARANGLPVPDFIPMTPGWPATDADLAPVLEDSYHFFYLSELLHNEDAPYVIPPRLAVFNGVEAWIFAMLPALWKDTERRLPRPVLLASWLLLGINLTNAFLAPYLTITELRSSLDPKRAAAAVTTSNSFLSVAFPRVFGVIASAVVCYALYQSTAVATASDWTEFWELVKVDRSYLAFCVDPVLFAMFQPLILARVKPKLDAIDYVPFVGLVAWLFTVDTETNHI